MRLLKLSLKNFKGCRSFVLDIQGKDCNIYGDNATGKSSIYDAFLWLLFGKDSHDKENFNIKTLDSNGYAIPGLSHEVEGNFSVDGKELTLKKVYVEKYTKKRLTGHTTIFTIDGDDSIKEKDYLAKINELCPESIFKLLTNPLYFSSTMSWQERRRILIEVCGDISIDDVIASDSSLAKLPSILKNRKLEDHRKVITARRSEINKELEKIPVRIDEATRSLPDVSGVFPSEVTGKIIILKTRLNEKNQEVVRIQAGGQVAEKTKTLREVEARLLDIRNKHRLTIEDKVQALRANLQTLYTKIDKWSSELRQASFALAQNQVGIDENEMSIAKLREEWHTVNSRQFEYSPEASVCPACGQDLPEEKLAQAREKAVAAFNLEKAMQLEKTSDEGKRRRLAVEELQSANETLEKEIAGLKAFIADAQADAVALQEQINTPASEGPEYIQALQSLKKEKESIERQIADLAAGGSAGQVTAVNAEISLLENEISALKDKLDSVDQQKKGQVRIEELKQQERQLAAEYERLEEEIYLSEQFIRRKVELLEDKINSRFKLARFKLFKQQVNGELSEVCETLYGGVPFRAGLNRGHQVVVGMDILQTLSEHYGLTPVIFVDNAESVTTLPKMSAQVIRLVKPEITDENREKYDQLVIEKKEVV